MPVTAAAVVPHPPIILPAVGRGEEEKIAATAAAYQTAMARLAATRPETIVIISPHAPFYADYFQLTNGEALSGDFASFGAPQLRVSARGDTGLAAALTSAAERAGLPAGTLGEQSQTLDHGTSIPLWFLQPHLSAFSLLRIGLADLPPGTHRRMGRCLAETIGAKRVAVIASGDLSHKLKADGPYGFAEEGPKLDEQITRGLAKGDFPALCGIDPALAAAGAECGLRAFWLLGGALEGGAFTPELLSYEGPFGVGYAVATFTREGEA